MKDSLDMFSTNVYDTLCDNEFEKEFPYYDEMSSAEETAEVDLWLCGYRAGWKNAIAYMQVLAKSASAAVSE